MVKAVAPSKPLKDVEAGRADAALIDDEQLAQMKEIAPDLKVIWTSTGAAADAGGGVQQERDAGRSRRVRQGAAQALRGRQGQRGVRVDVHRPVHARRQGGVHGGGEEATTRSGGGEKASGEKGAGEKSASAKSSRKSETTPGGLAIAALAVVTLAGCPVPPIKSGATVTSEKLPEKLPDLIKYADDIRAKPERDVGADGERAARARQGDQGRSQELRGAVEGGARRHRARRRVLRRQDQARALLRARHRVRQGGDRARAQARRGALLQRHQPRAVGDDEGGGREVHGAVGARRGQEGARHRRLLRSRRAAAPARRAVHRRRRRGRPRSAIPTRARS